MKALVIILSLVCAGMAYGLFQRNSSAGKRATETETLLTTLSNKVSELETKVIMTQAEAAHAQSNLQSLVTLRTSELANTSNRLVQLNLLYRAAQTDGRTAQSDAQSLAGKLAVLEAERDALQRNLTAVAAVEKKLADAQDKLSATTAERNSFRQDIGRLELEKAELLRKLEDVNFLRLQLTRAEEDAAELRRLAKAGPAAPVSSRTRLELLDDGTVRPALPANSSDPK
jgi:chromosome segregation ATPase